MRRLAFLFALSLISLSALAEERHFSVVAVEIGGGKFWIPSTLVVKKGDVVKISAVSKVPGDANKSTHGFAIDAFKVAEIVDTKGKEMTFTADKAGIFPIRCQMHPAHIGGQFVVME